MVLPPGNALAQRLRASGPRRPAFDVENQGESTAHESRESCEAMCPESPGRHGKAMGVLRKATSSFLRDSGSEAPIGGRRTRVMLVVGEVRRSCLDVRLVRRSPNILPISGSVRSSVRPRVRPRVRPPGSTFGGTEVPERSRATAWEPSHVGTEPVGPSQVLKTSSKSRKTDVLLSHAKGIEVKLQKMKIGKLLNPSSTNW